MANTLKVTLVKSPIGAVPKHKKTVAAMGLTKMHKTVEMPDNAATRGMIQQVQHLRGCVRAFRQPPCQPQLGCQQRDKEIGNIRKDDFLHFEVHKSTP